LISFFACTEPTLIGSDLLAEDQANLSFRDDIPVEVSTVTSEPVPTYNRFQSLQLEHYLLGELQDEQFGTSTASLYSQIARGVGNPGTEIVVDSLILSIAYDTIGQYGDLTQPIELEVFRVTEPMDPDADYNSDQVFATDPMPIGSASIVPSFDSVQIINYIGDEPITTREVPHIRIPLDIAFADLLVEDPSIYQSDTTFRDFLQGLYVRPSSSSNGVVPLTFNSSISRLTLYYSFRVRSIPTEYRFPFLFGQARVSQFEHDHEGAAANNQLNQSNTDEIYVQSMGGLNLEVNFPNLSDLENTVVNKAELEFTVASTSIADTATFPVVEQLIVTHIQNGERIAIADVRNAIFGSVPINSDIFGGVPIKEEVNGQTVLKYRINISSHFQDIISNNAASSIIITSGTDEFGLYFPITPKAERANQVIFYGSNHPDFAPKLNLTFTNL